MKIKLTAVGVGLVLVAATISVVAPAAATADPVSVVNCLIPGRVQDPHLSTAGKKIGQTWVKAGANLQCDVAEPATITASITLQKQSYIPLFWDDVATGPEITHQVTPGTTMLWFKSTLSAFVTCVPGTYRARLNVRAETADGPVLMFENGTLSTARTTDCKWPHVSMVIDDTGSMGGILGSVSSSLGSFIQSRDEDEYTKWSLTTFKDSPTYVGTTEDQNQALSWVNGLAASGGGDCPEDALGGISTGLNALGTDPDTDKQLIIATDASAHGGDINGIIATAQASGAHVNVLLAGDCGYPSAAAPTASATTDYPYEVSSQVVLRHIAEATGGRYFFIPGGSTADYTAALNAIFAGIANPGEDTEPPTVTLSGVPSTIWSPNHKMVEVTPTVTATDNQDPSPVVKLVGVQVSQPDDGQGDGNTSGDVEVTADGHIFVRAERSATDGARTYTITYKATDQSGNTGFGSATVVVPKDNSGK